MSPTTRTCESFEAVLSLSYFFAGAQCLYLQIPALFATEASLHSNGAPSRPRRAAACVMFVSAIMCCFMLFQYSACQRSAIVCFVSARLSAIVCCFMLYRCFSAWSAPPLALL